MLTNKSTNRALDDLPRSRYEALRRAAAAIDRAEQGEGQTALDAADRWLTLAQRWADRD